MLRECIRHSELTEKLLYSDKFYTFFTLVELSFFDVASDAFASFKVSYHIVVFLVYMYVCTLVFVCVFSRVRGVHLNLCACHIHDECMCNGFVSVNANKTQGSCIEIFRIEVR